MCETGPCYPASLQGKKSQYFHNYIVSRGAGGAVVDREGGDMGSKEERGKQEQLIVMVMDHFH